MTTHEALRANCTPAIGVLRIAIFNALEAKRVHRKVDLQLCIKALLDVRFATKNAKSLRELVERIDQSHRAYGPESSFWLDRPKEDYERTASKATDEMYKSIKVTQASRLPQE